MLSFFRRGIMAKLMLGVLFIGLVAIVITGFGTGGMGGLGDLGGLRGGTVASVGGEKITSDAAARRDPAPVRAAPPRAARARHGRPSFAGGALEQVLDQLIDLTAAHRLRRASRASPCRRRMIDREIAGVPAFQDLAGRFDDATFRRVLAQEKITEQQLREDIATRLIQRQLILPAAASAYVPQRARPPICLAAAREPHRHGRGGAVGGDGRPARSRATPSSPPSTGAMQAATPSPSGG